MKTINAIAFYEDEMGDPDRFTLIASQLETAARILRASREARLDSVAWRVADAGAELRELIESLGIDDCVAVHHRTGFGALLPDRARRTPANKAIQ